MKMMRKTAAGLLSIVMALSVATSVTPVVFAAGETGDGSSTGQTAAVTVAEGAYLTFKEGETLQLSAQGGSTYEWTKDGKKLASGGRVQILNSSTLVITGLTTADAGT